MSTTSKLSAIDIALKSLIHQRSAVDMALAAIARPSAIDKALQLFSSQQSAAVKALAFHAKTSAIENVLKSFANQRSAVNIALAAMAKPSAADIALQYVAAQRLAVDKTLAAMTRPSAIDKALQSLSQQRSAIDEAMSAVAKRVDRSAIESTLTSFAKSSALLLSDQKYLNEIAYSFENIDFNSFDDSCLEDVIEQTNTQLSQVQDAESLVKTFFSLPPWFQAVLFFLLLHVFLPQINSISANLLTPVVESYLANSSVCDKDKVKKIKKIAVSIKDVDTSNIRFIISNDVKLRQKPSTESAVLDRLVFGQVVTVLSKKKNWIEVLCEYENGEVVRGWVFTTYTAKFK